MFVTLPSPHLRALARPFALEVLRAKERAPTPYYSSVVSTLGSHLSL